MSGYVLSIDQATTSSDTTLNHGVYMVPAFIGKSASHWTLNARGTIMGLTRVSGIKEIVTSVLHAIL